MKLVALTATWLAIFGAAPALAQGGVGVNSDAFVDQVGSVQQAIVTQQGPSTSRVTQDGARQSARVSQRASTGGPARLTLDMRGFDNDATVTQRGVAVATIEMTGVGNSALIAQRGGAFNAANVVALRQNGASNRAELRQDGTGNAIDLTQNNDNNMAAITQTGDRLSLAMVQNGGAVATITQTRP